MHHTANVRVVETTDLELISRMELEIPEFSAPYSLEKLIARLSGRTWLALLAEDSVTGEALGYKLGYAETETRFYSWVGAVKPSARQRGVARSLMHRQEQWCTAQGFETVHVWSENRYRGMLIFLLTEGYDIFAVTADGAIMFRKILRPDC